MARQGVIPKRLASCPIPACVSCLYGRATKKKWRSRIPNNKNTHHRPTKPGQCVSVDMLQSPSPGFIAQMTGKLTTQRYNYACVYVDQFSGFGYTHFQRTANADETLKGKLAFELIAKQHGVGIDAYHADCRFSQATHL